MAFYHRRVFSYKIDKKPETEIFVFYGIIREPIEIQIHPAPKNDRLDFSFMKDIHAIAEKMARKGRK